MRFYRGFQSLYVTAAWILTPIIAFILLLTPVRLNYSANEIQSFKALPDPILFSALFMILTSLSLYLALRTDSTPFQRILSISSFALFFGTAFWVYSQGGYIFENFNFASDARYVSTMGLLPAQTFYQGEPGSGLIVSEVSQLSGMTVFQVIVLLSFLETLLFVTIIFVLLNLTLHSDRLSALGCLILMFADIAVGSQVGFFWPETLGDLLFFPLIVLVLTKFESSKVTFAVITSVLLAAITVTHFASALVVAAFLSVSSFVAMFSKDPSNRPTGWITLLSLALLLSWQVYLSDSIVPLLSTLSASIKGIFVGSVSFSSTVSTSVSSSGLNPNKLPLWASSVELLWAGIMVVTTLFSMHALVRRRLSKVNTSGILTSLAFLTAGLAFVPVPGFGLGPALIRTLLYIGFFTIPTFLHYISNWGQRSRNAILTAMVLLLLVTAFPTTLVYHAGVATQSYSRQDLNIGSFLEYYSEQGSQVYGVSSGYPYLQYFLLFKGPPCVLYSTFFAWTAASNKSSETILRSEEAVLTNFESNSCGRGLLVFSSAEWVAPLLQSSNGIKEVPEISSLITNTHDLSRVYDVGQIQIYAG